MSINRRFSGLRTMYFTIWKQIFNATVLHLGYIDIAVIRESTTSILGKWWWHLSNLELSCKKRTCGKHIAMLKTGTKRTSINNLVCFADTFLLGGETSCTDKLNWIASMSDTKFNRILYNALKKEKTRKEK